jgi:aldehyde dehydrogenase (NAD(P)+)
MSNISSIVNRARDAFNSGKTRPLQFRVEQLEALQRMINENLKGISKALASNLRKVRWVWGESGAEW